MALAHIELAKAKRQARQSQWVDLFVQQCRASRLPAPEQEYRFHPERRRRFDLSWPEIRVALEIDGGIWTGGRHVRPVGYRKDVEKLNAATLLGWRVLRAVPEQVRSGEALAWVRSLMAGAI